MALERGLPLLTLGFAIASFGLSPMAYAVTPAPEGGYPGGNTAEGDDALFSLTTGSRIGINNTAAGWQALYFNTTGNDNTATGLAALHRNIDGSANTATGLQSLYGNTSGNFNTADGYNALSNNTTGNDNTANGANGRAL